MKFPSQKQLQKARKALNHAEASRPLPKNASKTDRIKYNLCEQFVIYKNQNQLSQKVLAQKIGIDVALMSKVLNYHFQEFTIDRLVAFLEEIHPNLNISINVA